MSSKQKGSFGLPDDLMHEINKSKEKEKTVTEPAKSKEEVEEVDEVEKILLEAEESLGITVTEDDVVDALFNSSLVKRNVVIIPDKIHATFKFSMTINEANEIDRKMAEAMEYKLLESGFKNLRSQHIIARGVLEIGKPGATKPVGPDTESRFEEVGKMSALLVEKLVEKWNIFVYLITNRLQQAQKVKKH